MNMDNMGNIWMKDVNDIKAADSYCSRHYGTLQ